MNKTISITRIAILFALFSLGFIFVVGEEADEGLSNFFLHLIIDKAIGVACLFYMGRLYKRWAKVDPWLKAYDKMCDEVMEAPNPV